MARNSVDSEFTVDQNKFSVFGKGNISIISFINESYQNSKDHQNPNRKDETRRFSSEAILEICHHVSCCVALGARWLRKEREKKRKIEEMEFQFEFVDEKASRWNFRMKIKTSHHENEHREMSYERLREIDLAVKSLIMPRLRLSSLDSKCGQVGWTSRRLWISRDLRRSAQSWLFFLF
jgi:hypothetical protein